ncbi:MAG: AAA family ATPase, partial [Oligoflexales bacterium]|nr:AAA family ATPase [Oligoflexales bacterium]
MASVLKSGQRIAAGRFELVKPLGKGGFSQTFEAYDHSSNPPALVAIKWLLPGAGDNYKERLRDDYFHECVILEKIRHPGIIKIMEMGKEEGLPYLVMEYLGGGTFQSKLSGKKKGSDKYRVDPMSLVNIAITLTEALEQVHSNGIIHGDIKPANIGFRSVDDQTPVLFDFGQAFLSSLEDDDTKRTMVASLPYMPPERLGFIGSTPKASSDLYSLGISLYEIATGTMLFSGKSHQDICDQILGTIPDPLDHVVEDFSGPLSDIIGKLIRKQPDDRYLTAFGLLQDLNRAKKDMVDGDVKYFALGTKDVKRELNYRIPMVGREKDMAELNDFLKEAESGTGSFAIIGAASGVGKTRLVREFLSSATERGFLPLRVKFTEFEQNVPLSAVERAMPYVQQIMSRLSDNERKIWHIELQNKLAGRGQLILRKFPYLAQYLPAFPPFAKVDPETEEAIFLETLVDFIPLIFGPGRNCVIFFDDLQWADNFCLKLVKTFARRCRQHNLGHSLFLGAFRSDEGDNVNEIIIPKLETRQYLTLELLSEDDTGRLIELLLDESGEEIKKLQHLAYDITRGNPFFVYEFLNSALKNGLFRMTSSGNWIFDDSQRALGEISESVTELVTSRIKKISKNAYNALCTASVVGNNVPLEFLRELLVKGLERDRGHPTDSKDISYLGSALHELQHNHLIWPNENQIVFFHDRIRSSAYAILSEDERKFIHREYFIILYNSYFKNNEKIDPTILFETAFHVQMSMPNNKILESRIILKLAGERALDLFAYSRAKEYLKVCSTLYPKDFNVIIEQNYLDEYCYVQECLADALALSEDIRQAIIIYDFILSYIRGEERRTFVYLKLCNNHLYMFQYEDSIASANLGLHELGEKLRTSELTSLIYFIICFPLMILYLVWFRFFGRQNKEIKDNREDMLWNLRIGVQVPTFFTRPIVAIARQIPYTTRLLSYKDNRYRTMVIVYWGVVAAVLGLDRISEYCYRKGILYFKSNYDPLLYAFTLFTNAYLLDFPQGRLKVAESKTHEALRISINVGETFVRFLSYQSLIHIDSYGGDTGDSENAIEKLEQFWRKIGFVPTILGCRLRFSVMRNETMETNTWINIVLEAGKKIHAEGFETIDTVYSELAPAEAFILRDEFHRAIPLLKSAVKSIIFRFHRVSYCNYAPILLSTAYTRSKQPWKGLFSLSFTILNLLFSSKIFFPQTRFALGEALYNIGFKKHGRRSMEKAMFQAVVNGYAPVAEECRMNLALNIMHEDTEYAEYLLITAKKYFDNRGFIYMSEKCVSYLTEISNHRIRMFPHLSEKRVTMESSSVMRNILEASTLLELFTKLSVISDLSSLLKTAIDTTCHISGADHGIIFVRQDDKWIPKEGKNIEIKSESLRDLASDMDLLFFEKTIAHNLDNIKIRQTSGSSRNNSKSVMIMPLRYQAETYGIIYLGSQTISNLFDARSVEILRHVGTQIAVSIQNFFLLDKTQNLVEELKKSGEQISGLNDQLKDHIYHLDQLVDSKTRDIKSILNNITQGILTIGDSNLIGADYSPYVLKILETDDITGKNAIDLIFKDSNLSADEISMIDSSIRFSIGSLKLGFEINSEKLPAEFKLITDKETHHEKIIEVDWVPIIDSQDFIERIMVVLRDVTQMRKLGDIIQKHEDELIVISELIFATKPKFFLFSDTFKCRYEEDKMMIMSGNKDDGLILKKLFRDIHTLKASSRTFGFKKLTMAFHEFEQKY